MKIFALLVALAVGLCVSKTEIVSRTTWLVAWVIPLSVTVMVYQVLQLLGLLPAVVAKRQVMREPLVVVLLLGLIMVGHQWWLEWGNSKSYLIIPVMALLLWGLKKILQELLDPFPLLTLPPWLKFKITTIRIWPTKVNSTVALRLSGLEPRLQKLLGADAASVLMQSLLARGDWTSTELGSFEAAIGRLELAVSQKGDLLAGLEEVSQGLAPDPTPDPTQMFLDLPAAAKP